MDYYVAVNTQSGAATEAWPASEGIRTDLDREEFSQYMVSRADSEDEARERAESIHLGVIEKRDIEAVTNRVMPNRWARGRTGDL